MLDTVLTMRPTRAEVNVLIKAVVLSLVATLCKVLQGADCNCSKMMSPCTTKPFNSLLPNDAGFKRRFHPCFF